MIGQVDNVKHNQGITNQSFYLLYKKFLTYLEFQLYECQMSNFDDYGCTFLNTS
jgi:hypothetical protein